MKISIIIAAHKPYPMPYGRMYLPLQVGAAGKPSIGEPESNCIDPSGQWDSTRHEFLRDDSGDNISAKNPYYCELTGMYWAWKNLDSDVLGLVHYRRHFTLRPRSWQKTHPWQESVLTEEELRTIIEMYTGSEAASPIRKLILVPKKRNYYIESLYSHYAHTHDGAHLDKCRDIISRQCPEYLPYYDSVVKRTWGYMWNMLIASRDEYDRYLSWLFPILEKLEGEIDLSGMTGFEQRLFGRVSEILFNVWLEKEKEQDIILAELPVLHTDPENWPQKIRSFLSAKLFGKKYEKSF